MNKIMFSFKKEKTKYVLSRKDYHFGQSNSLMDKCLIFFNSISSLRVKEQ